MVAGAECYSIHASVVAHQFYRGHKKHIMEESTLDFNTWECTVSMHQLVVRTNVSGQWKKGLSSRWWSQWAASKEVRSRQDPVGPGLLSTRCCVCLLTVSEAVGALPATTLCACQNFVADRLYLDIGADGEAEGWHRRCCGVGAAAWGR